jgi:hypothetical protein
MDLRVGLDDLENRKFFTLPDSNSDPSVVQSVASRYTDYAIPAPISVRVPCIKRSRDSIVGIAASYVLDDRGVGVRVPVKVNVKLSLCLTN